jgi:hypothetical protein
VNVWRGHFQFLGRHRNHLLCSRRERSNRRHLRLVSSLFCSVLILFFLDLSYF